MILYDEYLLVLDESTLNILDYVLIVAFVFVHYLLERSLSFAGRVESLYFWDERALGRGWILECPEGRFLSLLVSLTPLRVTVSINLDDIPSPLRSSIQFTFTRPHFTSLELTGVDNLPHAFLAHCPALRSLTLTRVSFVGGFVSALVASPDSTRPHLEHLPPPQAPHLRLARALHCLAGISARHFMSSLARVQPQPARRRSRDPAPHQHLSVKPATPAAQPPRPFTIELQGLAGLKILSLNLFLGTLTPVEHLLSLGNIIFSPLQQALALDLHIYWPYPQPGQRRPSSGCSPAPNECHCYSFAHGSGAAKRKIHRCDRLEDAVADVKAGRAGGVARSEVADSRVHLNGCLLDDYPNTRVLNSETP
ncbi:hypothetical protein K438DRAFT_1762389 [Mycena galopus ATCC 62051]|nr:hypothetical protein K438DRAFT_1762389 [Mycena galopus ATCC 62051]